MPFYYYNCVFKPGVCVKPLITCGVIWTLYDWLNNSCCFSVPALAIDIMHGRGSSSKMCPQLQLKNGKAVLAIDIAAKGLICPVHY